MTLIEVARRYFKQPLQRIEGISKYFACSIEISTASTLPQLLKKANR